jgi:hypothetical protein
MPAVCSAHTWQEVCACNCATATASTCMRGSSVFRVPVCRVDVRRVSLKHYVKCSSHCCLRLQVSALRCFSYCLRKHLLCNAAVRPAGTCAITAVGSGHFCMLCNRLGSRRKPGCFLMRTARLAFCTLCAGVTAGVAVTVATGLFSQRFACLCHVVAHAQSRMRWAVHHRVQRAQLAICCSLQVRCCLFGHVCDPCETWQAPSCCLLQAAACYKLDTQGGDFTLWYDLCIGQCTATVACVVIISVQWVLCHMTLPRCAILCVF